MVLTVAAPAAVLSARPARAISAIDSFLTSVSPAFLLRHHLPDARVAQADGRAWAAAWIRRSGRRGDDVLEGAPHAVRSLLVGDDVGAMRLDDLLGHGIRRGLLEVSGGHRHIAGRG